jgi:hypothetical protein
MKWIHVRQNYDTGMVEQWILRLGNVPACSLRRDVRGGWHASLLLLTGISCRIQLLGSGETLAQAQARCENELREMGWRCA